jgi:hypothetical protein
MRKQPLMPRLGLMHRPLQTLKQPLMPKPPPTPKPPQMLKRAPPLELLLEPEAAPAPLALELV